MSKRGKSGKSSKQSNIASPSTTAPSNNSVTTSLSSSLTPVEKISIAISIGSHSCTVAYYNVNDQKAVIISNPDGLYATPTTITPVETDHGTVETFGRAWNSTPNQKTMFFGGNTTSDMRRNEPLMENMIRHMIHIAEDFTGKVVDSILLITPVNYTLEQNEMLERIVLHNLRLNLLQTCSSPMLACLAYEFDKPVTNTPTTGGENNNTPTTTPTTPTTASEGNKRELIMVLDYGFQSSQASLVVRHVDTGLLTLLHSETSNAIGGYQIDQCVIEYVISEMTKKYFNNRLSNEQKQILSNPESRVVKKLLESIESAKLTLSNPNVNRGNISVESLLDGIDVNIDLMRGDRKSVV